MTARLSSVHSAVADSRNRAIGGLGIVKNSPVVSFLAFAIVTATCGHARADSHIEILEFSGLLDSELVIGSKSGEMQKAEFTLTPEIRLQFTESTRVTVIGRIRADFADELEPEQPSQRNRSHLSGRSFVGDVTEIELRELFIDAEIGNTFLRIGKQQVVWGQADGLKVLDVINPQSFREFVLDNFDESRIPLWMVNAEIPIGDTFLQLLWIPDRTYADIPDPISIFAFTSPQLVPAVPPSIPVTILPPKRPGNFFGDSDVGARLSAFVGGWDISVNYAYHYFDRPITRRDVSATGIAVRQNFERTHLLGGTFSNVFGGFTLRGEFGYSSDRYFLTSSLTDEDGIIQSSEFAYVLGLDYQGWRDWFLSAQVFQSIVNNPGPGLLRDRHDTTATLLVRRDFLNEALQAEVLFIHSLSQSDGLIQASVKYDWHSNIQLKAGADIFYGTTQGLFGEFKDKDRISFGVEIGF